MSKSNGHPVPNTPLTVLVYQDTVGADTWIAQVLEKDMAAHGTTPEAAVAAVETVCLAHLEFDKRHDLEPLSRLKPAPAAFWDAVENPTSPRCVPRGPFTSTRLVKLVSREPAGV